MRKLKHSRNPEANTCFSCFRRCVFNETATLFSRFRQISVPGITYFQNRYHVNNLRNAKLHSETSLSHFLLAAETWSYGPATCLFFSLSVALTTSMSLKNYFHTQMPIFLVVNIYKFCHTIQYSERVFIVFLDSKQPLHMHASAPRRCEP